MVWTYNYSYSDVLVHHGIKGQKWGVRRYQNENGSLTNAGKKRYSSFATKRYARKAKKYEDKAQKALGEHKSNSIDRSMKYKWKAKEYSQRAKRSQEFDDNYANELAKRGPVRNAVNSALVGPFAYSAYVQQRAAGIKKGRAIVNTLLAGSLASAKVRSDYINQDVKKDREDSKARRRAGDKFNAAANEYRNARQSRSKKDIARYEKAANRLRDQGLSELSKRGLGYNDIRGKDANSAMAKKNFDYRKDRYYHTRTFW